MCAVPQHAAEPGHDRRPARRRPGPAPRLGGRVVAHQHETRGGAGERDDRDGAQRPAPADPGREPGHRRRAHQSPEDAAAAVVAERVAKYGAGNHAAAILSAPTNMTDAPAPTRNRPANRSAGPAASAMRQRPRAHHEPPGRHHPPDAQPVHQDARRNHQPRVGVEVRRGQQADEGAGRAEAPASAPWRTPRARAVEEGEEEQEGRNAPHEPRPRGGADLAGHAEALRRGAGTPRAQRAVRREPDAPPLTDQRDRAAQPARFLRICSAWTWPWSA